MLSNVVSSTWTGVMDMWSLTGRIDHAVGLSRAV